jgi:S1-C subfamily serine protease
VIVKADGTDIRTADDLIAFLGTKKPGDTITVTVERDGKAHDLKVTLAERPGNL